MTFREARVRKLLTIRAVAQLARVSTSTIYKMEHRQATPSLSTIAKLVEVLEVSPEEVDEFVQAMDAASGMAPRPARG